MPSTKALLLTLLLLPALTGCGAGPASLAYTRGTYFQARGNEHLRNEDPLGEEGIKEYQSAIEQFDTAIRLQPRYEKAYLSRGDCYWRLGKLDPALKDMSEAIALEPMDPNTWRARAIVYREQGLADRAAEDFRQELKLNAGTARSWAALSECEAKLGLADQSKRDFEEAVKLTPKDADIYCERAVAMRQLNDLDGMRKNFAKAIGLRPHSAEIYQRRAYAEFIVGDYEGAERDLAKVGALSDWTYRGMPYAVILGSMSCALQGQKEDAENWLEDGISAFKIQVATRAGAHDAAPDQTWPHPAIQYLHGDIDEGAFLMAAGTNSDRLTETHAYIGLHDLVAGRKPEAIKHLQWVVANGNKFFVEYEVAQAHLKKLKV